MAYRLKIISEILNPIDIIKSYYSFKEKEIEHNTDIEKTNIQADTIKELKDKEVEKDIKLSEHGIKKYNIDKEVEKDIKLSEHGIEKHKIDKEVEKDIKLSEHSIEKHKIDKKATEKTIEIKKNQIKEYETKLNKIYTELIEFNIEKTVRKSIQNNLSTYKESISLCNQNLFDLTYKIDKQKEKVIPLENEVLKEEGFLDGVKKQILELSNDFEKQVYHLKRLKFKFKDMMVEDDYLRNYKQDKILLQEIEDKISNKELEILSRELRKIDKVKELKIYKNELQKLQVEYRSWEAKKSSIESRFDQVTHSEIIEQSKNSLFDDEYIDIEVDNNFQKLNIK